MKLRSSRESYPSSKMGSWLREIVRKNFKMSYLKPRLKSVVSRKRTRESRKSTKIWQSKSRNWRIQSSRKDTKSMYLYPHSETHGKTIRKIEGTLKQKPRRAEKQQKFRTFWFSHLIFTSMISRPLPPDIYFLYLYIYADPLAIHIDPDQS